MKLWISAEMQHDVANAYREARKDVETALTGPFQRQCDKGVEKLALIGIVLPERLYPEVKKYSSRTKVAEFRLYIDHAAFLSADTQKRRGLLCDAVLQAVRLLPEVGAKQVDHHRLASEIEAVAAEQGWPLGTGGTRS